MRPALAHADNPEFMFQQPDNNIGMQNMGHFVNGRRWFHTLMDTGEHTEAGNDVNQDAVGLLGPHFNQKTCFGCHINNARSLAPTVINQRLDTMAVLTAELDANGHQVPHPMYGAAVQMNSQASTNGVTTDWGLGVRVSDFETKSMTLADADLQLLTRYVSLLGVPAQRTLTSGFPKGVAPLPYLDVNPAQIAAGAKVFETIRCNSCHTKQWKTGTGSEMAEARNQTIMAYSDLLLHDMGPDLADGFTEGQATGSMFRTSPLWGVGYTPWVAGNQRVGGSIKMGFLHDGRAANLMEATLWHGGEATASRQRFQALSTEDRAALLAFLGSL